MNKYNFFSKSFQLGALPPMTVVVLPIVALIVNLFEFVVLSNNNSAILLFLMQYPLMRMLILIVVESTNNEKCKIKNANIIVYILLLLFNLLLSIFLINKGAFFSTTLYILITHLLIGYWIIIMYTNKNNINLLNNFITNFEDSILTDPSVLSTILCLIVLSVGFYFLENKILKLNAIITIYGCILTLIHSVFWRYIYFTEEKAKNEIG